MGLPVRRSASQAPLAERQEPFSQLEELQRMTRELMETVWSGAGDGGRGVWSPMVDIEETEDAWIVEAELPGVSKKDVNVEVRDSEVEISGEIKERERKGILRRRTRRTGQFDYRVTLPGEVDPDGVDASLEDGMLTLRIPKPEQARPRRVEVKSG
jgi:HSP20 family protein